MYVVVPTVSHAAGFRRAAELLVTLWAGPLTVVDAA
jgi:hypothetical protein